MAEVVIIGSGMAGLSWARRLARAGLRPLVLDKGRGIGGRVATRQVQGLQFDHGAQFLTARAPGFVAELAALGPVLAPWYGDRGRLVGVPGMTALPQALAEGLEIRQGLQVQRIETLADGFAIHAGAERFTARRVVVTIPAPQVAALLGADHPLVAALEPVRLAPCLTLMAAIAGPAPFVTRADDQDPLAWIALDSSKPGRQGQGLWVAQAGEAFSRAHLEDSPEAIAAAMLPLLCDRLGVTADRVAHASAHRWRHARVTQALGQPFLAQGGLYLGGDWCIGPRVEAAWTSGLAMAEDILARSP